MSALGHRRTKARCGRVGPSRRAERDAEQSVMQSLEVANRAYILADGLFVMSVIVADFGAHPELKRAYLGL
jgi:hypothetical protein